MGAFAIFKYFFTYYSALPDGAGFRPFGPGHVAWLAAAVCAAVLICMRYKALPRNRRRRLELIVCWTILILDIFRFIYQLALEGFTPDLLPLHLCGMAVYISLLNALRPGGLKREILFSLCMPGAAVAMLFPAWTVYPIANIFCLFCFLIHTLLVVYPLMLLAGGDMRPDYRNLPKCLLFLVVAAVPVYLFNRAYGTNFMFINGTWGIFPLTLFEKWFGDPGYILGMLLLLMTVWACLYLPVTLLRFSRVRREIRELERGAAVSKARAVPAAKTE